MKRIIGFDLARGLAILAAMTAHAASTIGYQPSAPIELLFRIATPLFIVIFGFFLNKVYLKKIKAGFYTDVRNRLWIRAIQCYVLYCLSAIFLSIHEGYSIGYTLRMLLLIGSTPFTDILRYYAIILFISPFILRVINQRGLYPAVVIAIIPHIATLFQLHPALPDNKAIQLLASLFYGGTEFLAGPSILHSFIFILVGFVIADNITINNNKASILFGDNSKKIRWVFGASLATLVLMLYATNHTLLDLSSMKLRNENNLAFFAYGITASIIMIELSLIISNYVDNRWLKPFLLYGAHSLLLFSFGNMFLYLIMNDVSYSPSVLLGIEVVFLLLCLFNNYLSSIQSPSVKNMIDFISVGYAKKIINKVTA